jgi:hypothetical protein
MIIHKDGKTPEELRDGDEVNINGVICLTCGSVIVSRTRHDFVACACPQREFPEMTGIFVDGGWDYCRRGSGGRSRWIELKGVVHDVKGSGLAESGSEQVSS